MRIFSCPCGNDLFFENTLCVSCGRAVGWCPACRNITALLPENDGRLRCGRGECGAPLAPCQNYAVEHVCNRCCVVPGDASPPPPLCDCCRFNETIPDLSVPGNREKWRRLEEAKRRLLHTLDLLRLPYGGREEGVEPPLRFDFKADPHHEGWWAIGEGERVHTGHVDGRITINLREADPVEREKARVAFQERHRTLIGHFRHEIGHYYWQMLVQARCEPEFRAVFGDHEHPSYAEAQRRYYEQEPPARWHPEHVSAYATMHPWEDFAETVAAYLDMVSVLDTAANVGLGGVDPTRSQLREMVDAYVRLGVPLNEMNRAMGLVDLVPGIFTPPVVEKLGFVHDLLRGAARPE